MTQVSSGGREAPNGRTEITSKRSQYSLFNIYAYIVFSFSLLDLKVTGILKMKDTQFGVEVHPVGYFLVGTMSFSNLQGEDFRINSRKTRNVLFHEKEMSRLI